MFSARNLEGELLAEVDFSGYRIAGDLAGRARHENLALVQDVGAIGDRERLTHVGAGGRDADAPVAQAPDDLRDVADGDGVDAGDRLVEQQVLRRGHQRAGDLQPAPLAARQGEGRVRGERGQVQLRQQLARARATLEHREVERLEDGQQIFLDGQLAEHRRFLRQVAHAHPAALVHRERRDLLPFEEDAPALGGQQADHHVEGRRLAGAVGAEQTDHLAPLDVERDVVHDLAGLEPFLQALRDEAFHSILAGQRRGPHGGGGFSGLLLVLREEHALHPLLAPALHDRAVLRQEDRDALAAHNVVLLPHARVAEEDDALLEVVVFGASRGAGAAVARDDAHRARGHGPENAVAVLVEVDLHAIGVLHGVVLAGDDVAGEDHERFLAEALHLVRVHGDRLRAIALLLARRLRGLRGRLGGGRHRQRQDHGGARERGQPAHCARDLVNVARTRPATVAVSSSVVMSKAVPWITEPSRESVTGSSVQSRCASASQWITLVSLRRPSLEVMTTFFRTSTVLIFWWRASSSPTIVQERSFWDTRTVRFLRFVRPSCSYISACSARRRQRTPLVTSSRSTSLIRRSAVDGAGPSASTRAVRVRTTSVVATATTNTATTMRIARARFGISAISIPAYHSSARRNVKSTGGATRLDDFRAEDVVHMNDAGRPAVGVHGDEARDGPRLHHLQRFRGEVVGGDGLGGPRGHLARARVGRRAAGELQPPQVAVRDDADQPAVGGDDRRHG